MVRLEVGWELRLSTHCVNCGRERVLYERGRHVMDLDDAMIVRLEVPCWCGEYRVRVDWGLDCDGDASNGRTE